MATGLSQAMAPPKLMMVVVEHAAAAKEKGAGSLRMNELSPTYQQQHSLALSRVEPVAAAGRSERGHVRLLWIFAGVFVSLNLAILLLPAWVMRTDWYQVWPAYSYHLNLDYHLSRAGEHSETP